MDLVSDEGTKRYWCAFKTAPYSDIDVDVPHFWGYMAYLGGKFIENRQVFDEESGELFSPHEEAASRARDGGPTEPQLGEVCWTFDPPN